MSTHGHVAANSWIDRMAKIFITGWLFVSVAMIANAAELKQKTVEAWNEYVRAANSHMQERLQTDKHFLWIDEAPDRRARTRRGELLVSGVSTHNPKRVLSGLIHHWIGAAFIPNANLDEVFAVVRDYSRYKEFYRPAVVDSKPLSQAGTHDRFSMLLRNKAVLKRTALESDYESSYLHVDGKHWYSVASATRVQEIEDYGQSGERKVALNEGGGYVWRLHSISRFEERDGGVYIELEAIALSRDIPLSLRWLVDPIMRRVSRDALTTSLRQTSNAVASIAVARNSGTKEPTGYASRRSPGIKRLPQDTSAAETMLSGHGAER